MPEKKSFILYIDNKEVFDILSDAQLGRLTRLLIDFADTRTLESNIDDAAVNVAYRFMTTQMKRDIEKYDLVCQRRSEAGKKGGRPKKQTKANESNAFSEKAIESNEKQTKAKKAVTVTDTVTVLSLSKDNDNIEQACTAPKGAAQPACYDEYDYIEIDETSGEWA